METAFKIKNLKAYYGQKEALKEVNIDIQRRSVTARYSMTGKISIQKILMLLISEGR